MKLGIPLSWPTDAAAIGPEVGRIARRADEAGVDSLWTADHFFQIPVTGLPRESPMVEGYTLLSFLAGQTERVTLGAMVTCAVYRHPGVLVKAVTALDVLSGGRAVLGIGAGWDEEEATGLGVPWPPLRERLDRLEEVVQVARHMWSGDESPFEGRHYRMARPLNSPPALRRPHPPILIGGGGERRTLRLVAQYADACNLFDLPGPFGDDIAHKLDVLRGHCAAVGRDPGAIEKTTLTAFDLDGDPAAGRRALMRRLEQLAGLGVGHVVLMGPRFEWGDDLDTALDLVDDIHAIEPALAA